MKSSEGLTIRWSCLRRTKRSRKKGRKKPGNVLKGGLNPRIWIFFDNRLSKKYSQHWSKLIISWLNARNNARAWWIVQLIFLMNLSSAIRKLFTCAHFFQICRQERTRETKKRGLNLVLFRQEKGWKDTSKNNKNLR